MHIPGKSAIDCTGEANLFDVLVYASEEKDYNEAQALDFEASQKQ